MNRAPRQLAEWLVHGRQRDRIDDQVRVAAMAQRQAEQDRFIADSLDRDIDLLELFGEGAS